MIKCGYVAISGKPSSGKSTLINHLTGHPISITAATPQTTRQTILGIHTQSTTQIIYMDTPGMITSPKITKQSKMNTYMQQAAYTSLHGSDIVVWLIDGMKYGVQTEEISLKCLKNVTVPIILALNKMDKIKNRLQLLPLMARLQQQAVKITNRPISIIPISAYYKINLDYLEQKIIECLPQNAFCFPQTHITDKTLTFQLTEIIRQKIIQATQQEIPYIVAVEMEFLHQREQFIELSAIIWVERKNQKAILIGQQGTFLKKIGINARYALERVLTKKVFLRLLVRVKKNWTNDNPLLKSMGYA